MSDSYLNLNQKQIQTLKIGPQLQNSLKILQSASLDLRTAILSELQKNPLLEELPQEGISVEEEVELIEESPEQRTEELDFSDDDFSILDKIVDDNANRLIENNPVSAFDQEKSERKEHFINSLTKKESLQEHLL